MDGNAWPIWPPNLPTLASLILSLACVAGAAALIAANRARRPERATEHREPSGADPGRTTVADVMVPRRFVVALPEQADAAALRSAMLERGHRRVPVYSASADEITGYVLREDVLAALWDGKVPQIGALRRPPFFVPQSMPAERALRELQQRRLHLAIVVEEHGGTITLYNGPSGGACFTLRLPMGGPPKPAHD